METGRIARGATVLTRDMRRVVGMLPVGRLTEREHNELRLRFMRALDEVASRLATNGLWLRSQHNGHYEVVPSEAVAELVIRDARRDLVRMQTAARIHAECVDMDAMSSAERTRHSDACASLAGFLHSLKLARAKLRL